MLSRSHQCRTLLKPPIFLLNSLIFTKPSVFATIIAPADDHHHGATFSDQSQYGVYEIISAVVNFGSCKFFCNRALISLLDLDMIDRVIEIGRVQDPDFVLDLYRVLESEYGFQHSMFSKLAVAHILDGKRRFRMVNSILQQLVQEQGKVNFICM